MGEIILGINESNRRYREGETLCLNYNTIY